MYLISRLAFHKSGKPRGWVRAMLFNGRVARPTCSRIVLSKSGLPRPAFRDWVAAHDSVRTYSTAAEVEGQSTAATPANNIFTNGSEEVLTSVTSDKDESRSLNEAFLGPIPAFPIGIEGNKKLRDAFFGLISALRPSVFCDIGANDGSTSLAVRALAIDCSIFAFEANPNIYAMHAAAMEKTDIEWLNIAITDKRGCIPVFAPKTLTQAYIDGKIVPANITEQENTGKTSLLLRNEEATYERFDVAGLSLDAFFIEREIRMDARRAFLWIDVEGAALNVLNGAEAVLGATQAIFIETENFEFWKDQKGCVDVIEHLYKKGFQPVARDREYGDAQFNILFIHKELLKSLDFIDWKYNEELHSIFPPTVYSAIERVGQTSPTDTQRRAYFSVVDWLQSTIPALVPCFNNPTYVRSMLQQLRNIGFRDIIIVDNASTSPDMREWLKTLEGENKIIYLGENLGPRHIMLDEDIVGLLPQRFCLTDPDLVFNKSLPPNFVSQLASLARQHKVGKVGFALEISDRCMMVDRKFRIGESDYYIWEWESQFWKNPLGELEFGDRFYDAEIDTTFALYDKAYFDRSRAMNAIRVAGRYTARHLPWYRESGLPDAEELVYRTTQKFSYYLSDNPPK